MMWPPGIGRNISYISVIYGAHDKKSVHRFSFTPFYLKQFQEKETSDTINNAGAIAPAPRDIGSWRPVKSNKKTQKSWKSHKIQKIKTIQKM